MAEVIENRSLQQNENVICKWLACADCIQSCIQNNVSNAAGRLPYYQGVNE